MDSGLKKRLLGALVLIVLAVIFVPMLLPDHSGSGAQSVSLKVPPQPSGELQTRILKLGPDGASAGTTAQAAINDPDHVATLNLQNHAPAPVQPIASGASVMATTAPAAPAAASASTAGAAASAPPAATLAKALVPSAPVASASAPPLAGGAGAAAGALYTVNLGIYADHASASKLVAQAKQHGFTAIATPETFQGKAVSRVTVGPFHSRSAAEAARLKLKGIEHVSMSIESAAVDQAGDAPASALPANVPGAWAVQLAAFSDEASANAMRERLRGQGFDGYVDGMDTSKGKLWRVRAGPFTSRSAAESARGQIAQKLKIKGNIVTQH